MKKKTKIAIIIASVAVLLIAALAVVFFITKKNKPTPINQFEYILSDTHAAITKYCGDDEKVIVPREIEGRPVKVIGMSSFKDSKIKSVTLPDSVIVIQASSFWRCKDLAEVKMGNNVIRIMPNAFEECKSLKKINLSSALEEIGNEAFSKCSNLESITIPKLVKKIGMNAFADCKLSSLSFEVGIETIGPYGCFWGDNEFKSITIPSSVNSLGSQLFDSNLKEIYFLGDAPAQIAESPFGEDVTIYYKKGTKGWDNTELGKYKLIEN